MVVGSCNSAGGAVPAFRLFFGGDMVEFAELDTPANRSYVQRIAYAFGLTGADAEDVTQDVMLKAWLKCHTIRSDPRAWLNRVTVNACRDRLSEPHPFFVPLETLTDLPSREPSPLDVLLDSDRRLLVNLAVSQLNLINRQAVMLHYYDGLAVLDIAASVGVSVSGIKRRLDRSRQELRRRLAGVV